MSIERSQDYDQARPTTSGVDRVRSDLVVGMVASSCAGRESHDEGATCRSADRGPEQALCNRYIEGCRTAVVLQLGWMAADSGGRRLASDLHQRTQADFSGPPAEVYGSKGWGFESLRAHQSHHSRTPAKKIKAGVRGVQGHLGLEARIQQRGHRFAQRGVRHRHPLVLLGHE